ncbi:MCP four helix bundle domain-containing protein [Acetonema longum]|uniref:Chemotaxis methyl-accepting receptor HlyB-like 4HB MCP domain-containing protein n=1 Tax=Acetonema longum DSM 6540 TaxID=1009370 RepID=F7NEV2_9FIRM|nr:MCP four helix bundle domain-containing protein [Acetonema longum]EGO65513.1 hypothetical protein ALO_02846 [Acetonema longum DSM 6540]
MQRNWSMAGKFAIGFVLIIVLFSTAGYFADQHLNASLTALQDAANERGQKLQALRAMKQAHLTMEKYSFAILNGFADSKQVDAYRQKYQAEAQAVNQAWNTYEAVAKDAGESQIWVDYAAARQVWQKEQDDLLKLQTQPLSGKVLQEIAVRTARHEASAGRDIEKYLSGLIRHNEQTLAEEQGKLAGDMDELRLILAGMTALITLVAAVLAVLLAGSDAGGTRRGFRRINGIE